MSLKKRGVSWDKVKNHIRNEINEQNFNSWFTRSDIIEVRENGVVKIGFHSDIAKNWVKDHYFHIVRKALENQVPNISIIEVFCYTKKEN